MNLAALPADSISAAPACLAIGFFDGFHLGHRAVAQEALSEARAQHAEAWALTFSSHPLATVRPSAAPPLLSTASQRTAAFGALGFDGVCLVDFDASLASLAPDAFAARLSALFPRLISVHCGCNWRFGKGGEGTPATLDGAGSKCGFRVRIAQPVLLGGSLVSSTRIRAALSAGDLDAAAAMLGRPYSLSGVVEHGRRIGSAGGFPTANLNTYGRALPPAGVYAVSAAIDGREWPGVADLGWRPTFPDDRPSSPILEVHFLDLPPSTNLYGMLLDVAFLKRLRSEIAFPSKEALFAQIAEDAACARSLVAAR